MKQKKSGQTSAALVIFLAIIAIAGYLLWKQSTVNAGAINSIADLDKASQQLDKTDIDGVGNELQQNDADFSSF